MEFKTIEVNSVKVFYREAGKPGMPKLVLLHGFPSSSHQYRDLMTRLESYFHMVAPDYPGFGNSDMPDPKSYAYTFDNTAEVIHKFLQAVGFDRFGMYVQDYGGPVGFRLATQQPEILQWLTIQNTNAYEIGFTDVWSALRGVYWASRDAKAEAALDAFLQPETIKTIYMTGHTRPELVSPDNWNMDSFFLTRPGSHQVQLNFFYDYRTNVALYPKWQQFLRERQPPTIIFWGQGDIFFTPAGGEAYLKDLPKAEVHRLDSGHFAVEDHLEEIAAGMIAFHKKLARG
jgi:pimeloyl-ACP methyl ester carboxylesterase